MNILIFSQIGSALGLAYKLQAEGHSVAMHVEQPGCKMIGKGIVEPYKGGVKWDLVLADDAGFGGLCDKFKKAGVAVLGSSRTTDTWDTNMNINKQSLAACGLHVPIGNTVEKGVDLKFAAFFNGTDFLRPFGMSFIDYRLIEKSRGPLTDGMTATTIFKSKSRIFSDTMLKLRPVLAAMDYHGIVQLPCRVTQKDIIVFPVHFGIDRNMVNTMLPFMPRAGETLRKVATGVDDLTTDDVKTECWAVGVSAVELSWPKVYSKLGSIVQVPEGAVLGDIYKDDNSYKQATENAYLFTAVGTSGYINAAASRVYKSLAELGVTEVYWRQDAGVTATDKLSFLRKWGWIK
jgi:phosphoribosylamine-glycine ligase